MLFSKTVAYENYWENLTTRRQTEVYHVLASIPNAANTAVTMPKSPSKHFVKDVLFLYADGGVIIMAEKVAKPMMPVLLRLNAQLSSMLYRIRRDKLRSGTLEMRDTYLASSSSESRRASNGFW